MGRRFMVLFVFIRYNDIDDLLKISAASWAYKEGASYYGLDSEADPGK